MMGGLICFKHWWMRGLKEKESIVSDASSTAVQKFKKKLRWSKTEKWFDCGGIGILGYAVTSNEVHVVEELLKVLKRDFNGEEYTRHLESRTRDEGTLCWEFQGYNYVVGCDDDSERSSSFGVT